MYGRGETRARVKDLKGRLVGWFIGYVDLSLDGTHEAVTGQGQLDLAGPAGRGEKAFADDWQYLADGAAKPRSAYPLFEE